MADLNYLGKSLIQSPQFQLMGWKSKKREETNLLVLAVLLTNCIWELSYLIFKLERPRFTPSNMVATCNIQLFKFIGKKKG